MNDHDAIAMTTVTQTSKESAKLPFLASAKFEGSRPGYLYSNGPEGLGYYLDTQSTGKQDPFSLESMTPVWMYFSAGADTAQTKAIGPVTLKKLRTLSSTEAALVWKQGLASWMPREKVMELQQWLFLDPTKAPEPQQGPFWVEDVARFYNDGSVDQLTHFWCKGMSEWQPLVQLADLRDVLDGFVQRALPEAPPIEVGVDRDAVVPSSEELKKQQQSKLQQDPNQHQDSSSNDQTLSDKVLDKRKITDVYAGPKDGDEKSYTAEDGTQYTWDAETQKWIANGQNDETTEDNIKKKRKRKAKKKKKKTPDSMIYVSGLDPKTITEEELESIFTKWGIIKTSIFTGGPSITIYRLDDENKTPKGDATICYLKKESVPLAIQLMDEYEYRPGFKLSVSRAERNKSSGGAGQGKRKQTQLTHMTQAQIKQLQKQIKFQEKKKLSWADGPEHDDMRIVIIKHCFDPAEIEDEDVESDIKKELREGCEAAGSVQKVSLIHRNKEGVAIVKFEEAEGAQECVKKLNGRFFSKRRLDVELWDGVTNYTVKESDVESKRRIEDFGKFLDSMNEDEENTDEKIAKGESPKAHTEKNNADQVVPQNPISETAKQVTNKPPLNLDLLSAAGQEVAKAATELLETATADMLQDYIKAEDVQTLRKLVEETRMWLRENPSPDLKEAAMKKKSLTDNPIIAKVLASMG